MQIGIFSKWARSENGQKMFEVFWQEEEEELCIASWPDARRSGKALSNWKEDVKT